jgi:hypothetical protein
MPSSVLFEKRIWFYWHQGLNNAPDVVQKCYRSWRLRNPEWDVTPLRFSNLAYYLNPGDMNVLVTRPQAFSDLVRINLLKKYGGVWVDASCFCTTPLDSWMTDYVEAGFFAFRNPGPDRLLASWFLAADKDSYIAGRWADASNRYWSGQKVPTRLFGSRLAGWATVLWPDVWFTKPVKEWLGLYPYFWFHYLFRYLCAQDARFRAAWNAVPGFAANVPHGALCKGLNTPIDASFKREIDQGISPLYKLNWRVDEKSIGNDSVLHYLYQTL